MFIESLHGFSRVARARFRSTRSLPQLPQVELPFNYQPPTRTYLYSAYPSGIVTVGGSLQGPALNYSVQLFFPNAKLNETASDVQVGPLPGLGIQHFESLGYMKVRRWDCRTCLGMRDVDLVAMFVERLRAGGYLHAYVDEYFFPSSHCYLRRHFRHSALLVGYEPAVGAFQYAGYLRDGQFGRALIPARLVIESLRLEDFGIQKEGFETAVDELMPLAVYPALIDVALIRQQLVEYLDGTDTRTEYRCGGKYAIAGVRGVRYEGTGHCGAAVYGAFREYVKIVGHRLRSFDLRTTRALMEHKQLLQAVIGGVARTIEDRSIAEDYGLVVSIARRLHVTAFAATQQADGAEPKVLAGLLDEMERLERGILARVVG